MVGELRFKNFERVKFAGSPGIWVIAETRSDEKRYWLELNGDFASRVWKFDHELERAE
jgi:hypothetical protein